MESKTKYTTKLDKNLKEVFKTQNLLSIPRLDKITISVGIGKNRDKEEIITKISENLKIITGQKPLITKSKKSIAGFKVREGESVGLKITLRGKRMWTFFDKLINVTLPQIRDFQGIKFSSIDKNGNLSIGIKEQLIFPEISYDDISVIHGISITLSLKTKNKESAIEYLKALSFPFERK